MLALALDLGEAVARPYPLPLLLVRIPQRMSVSGAMGTGPHWRATTKGPLASLPQHTNPPGLSRLVWEGAAWEVQINGMACTPWALGGPLGHMGALLSSTIPFQCKSILGRTPATLGGTP